MSVTVRPGAASIKGGWLTPVGLLLLGLLPVIAGAFRLEQLSGISDAMPANPRFSPMPLPVVLHIVSATVLSLLGPLQFAAGFRRRWPVWHRLAGRVLVVCALLVALTGLWMTLLYLPADGTGPLLFVSRIVFGCAMVISIVVGLAAILRRDVQRHRLWISRAYAIGLGAATQMLVLMVAGIVVGPLNELTHDSLMALSWVINLAVVEWAIRGRRARRSRTTNPSAGDPQSASGLIKRWQRRRERAPRDLAPGRARNPLSAQEAAIAVLRISLEGDMGSSVGTAAFVGPAAHSRSPRTPDCLSSWRGVGSTCDALELCIRAIRQSTWRPVAEEPGHCDPVTGARGRW